MSKPISKEDVNRGYDFLKSNSEELLQLKMQKQQLEMENKKLIQGNGDKNKIESNKKKISELDKKIEDIRTQFQKKVKG